MMSHSLMLLAVLLLVLCSVQVVQSFRLVTQKSVLFASTLLRPNANTHLHSTVKQDYIVGENIPEEMLKLHPIYDMILVERFSEPERTSAGLFMPKVEGRDRKHIGKVVAKPTKHGLESENGRVQSIDEIMPYNVGDMVVLRVSYLCFTHTNSTD